VVHFADHFCDLGRDYIRHDLLLDDDFLHLGLIAHQLVRVNGYAPEEADVLVDSVSLSMCGAD
jgi:hypothetical protein